MLDVLPPPEKEEIYKKGKQLTLDLPKLKETFVNVPEKHRPTVLDQNKVGDFIVHTINNEAWE